MNSTGCVSLVCILSKDFLSIELNLKTVYAPSAFGNAIPISPFQPSVDREKMVCSQLSFEKMVNAELQVKGGNDDNSKIICLISQ